MPQGGGDCPWEFPLSVLETPCCIDGNCFTLPRCQCWDIGGTEYVAPENVFDDLFCEDMTEAQVEDFDCNDDEDPDYLGGCRGRATGLPSDQYYHHSHDLCETCIGLASRVIEETDPPGPTPPLSTWLPATLVKCRATPTGDGNDACQHYVGEVRNHWQTHPDLGFIIAPAPMMCTRREGGKSKFSRATIFINKSEDLDDHPELEGVVVPGSAAIAWSVEAPFWTEVNYYADGRLCGGPFL